MKARSATPVNGIGLPSDSNPSKERPDLSILRKPIPTSITGFRETIQAYENGTDEVNKYFQHYNIIELSNLRSTSPIQIRNLLANECDVIYECKACRNIFRSLANFISHKRIYCRANFCTTQHFHFHNDASGVDRDVATIVQAEQDFTAKVNTVVSSGKAPTKDLTSVIERLLRREHAARPLPNHEPVNPSIQLDTTPKTTDAIVLQLDKVLTSECAVFQTVRIESTAHPEAVQSSNTDSISKEVSELHNLQAENCGTLNPDGRLVFDVKPDLMTCDICKETNDFFLPFF